MTKKGKNSNNNNQLTKAEVDSVIFLYSSGKIAEAIKEIKALNVVYPNVPFLFNVLGACYKSLDRLDHAEKMFNTAIKIKSDYAEAYFNLGLTQKRLRKIDDAIISYKKALAIQPNYPDAHNNLGNVYRENGNIDQSLECYEWAVAYRPEFIEAYNNLGIALRDVNKIDLAIKNFKKALTLKPDFIDALFNLGLTYKDLGDKDLSIQYLENVIELSPKHFNSYRALSNQKKFVKNDLLISKMELLYSSNQLSQSGLIAICFSLSKAYEDLGLTEKQFKFLNEGNKTRKKELNYNFNQSLDLHMRIKSLFSKKLPKIKNSEYPHSKIKPIFIVGMPRSGTSLVEQIISSHNKVYGAGELGVIAEILKPIINKNNNLMSINKDLILSFRKQYFSKVSSLNISNCVFTDKMPSNFRFIGFILLAFPEARVIHLKRNPEATCWSIYKNYFGGSGLGFSYNQKDLAKYYRLYIELMDFWHNLFPGQIYDISYEALTINQEEEVKKLISSCGLEWDKNCLKSHENKRVVKTTSSLQVRKKIYQGSSDVWKKYEDHLKPLIKGLNTN